MANRANAVTVKVTDTGTDDQVFKQHKIEYSENKTLNNFSMTIKILEKKKKIYLLITSVILLLKYKHYK